MEKKKEFQTGNIITITFAHLVHDTYSSFLAPLLPLLIEKLSISYSLAGILSIFQRIPSLLNPFIGLIADKLPVRYFLIAAPSITAVSMSLLGAAPSYIVLAILLLVAGLGSALFHTPGPVMVKNIAGSRIGKGMSFFMLGGEFARSLGPLLVLSAVSLWGLEGTYKLIPLGLAASVILFFRFRKIEIKQPINKPEEQTGIKETLKMHLPTFVTVGGILFFTSMLKTSLTAFLPTFLTVQGKSLWLGGAALSVLQFAGAAGTFSSGTISDRIGRKNTLLITALSLPILMWLFILLSNVLMMFVLVLMGFFLFASTPVLLAVINNIKSERPAFINGIFMTINFLISALTVTIAGTFGDFFGLELTYKIAAFFPLLAIPFILKIKNK